METNHLGPRPIKRVFADIEVSPNLGLFWRPGHNVSIGPDAIVRERAIICICWKVQGSNRVKSLWWDNDQNDRTLLQAFFGDPDVQDADEVIAHFGEGFDIPWLRTRVLFHRLNPMPLFKIVDTKAWAAKNFYFNSNKLDYLGKFMTGSGKTKTEWEWWVDIMMKNCRATLFKMVRYCKDDVNKLEEVYELLAPHCPPKSHAGVVAGGDKWTCPRTGTDHVKVSKRRVTASGRIVWQMQNLDDGSYYSINNQAYETYCRAKKKRLPKV